MDVGMRLKSLRSAAQLSQRQLAARSGVTNGMISMIEQGQISPTIASIKKILGGLGVTLSDFFSETDGDRPTIFFRADELIEVTPGGPTERDTGRISFRQVGDTAGRSLQMLHERYEPGADTGAELYAHQGDEAGLVISGQIEVTVGDRRAVLGPGDAYAFDSRLPHRFRNIFDDVCVVVSACTPPTF